MAVMTEPQTKLLLACSKCERQYDATGYAPKSRFHCGCGETIVVPEVRAHDAAVVASTEADFDLPRGIEWDNSYKLQLVVTDLDKTNHHAESMISFDVWGPLELDVTFMFDRVEKPVPDAGGNVPKSNDYRVTMGLGIDF